MLSNILRYGSIIAAIAGVFAIIGDTDRLQVRADVDEQNATRIRPGQNGRASLKGDPEK